MLYVFYFLKKKFGTEETYCIRYKYVNLDIERG